MTEQRKRFQTWFASLGELYDQQRYLFGNTIFIYDEKYGYKNNAIQTAWITFQNMESNITELEVIKNRVDHILDDIETHIKYGCEFNYDKDFKQVQSLVLKLKDSLPKGP